MDERKIRSIRDERNGEMLRTISTEILKPGRDTSFLGHHRQSDSGIAGVSERQDNAGRIVW